MSLKNYIIRWCSFENIACKPFNLLREDRLYINKTNLDKDPCMRIDQDYCRNYE